MKNVGAYDIAELVDDELIHADYSTLPDDTEEQFLTIRKTILKYASDINKSKRDIKEIKSIKNFIGKIFLNIEIETVIAFIDTTFIGNGENGILFTTHAIYYKKAFENLIKIAYIDIVYEKCELLFNDKGIPSGINISLKDSASIKVVDSIKYDTLMNLIIEIGKISNFAPTDTPQKIDEMDYSLKLSFLKLMANFLKYSNQSCIELMRFACNIGVTDEQLSDFAKYIAGQKDSDLKILLQINDKSPYPSRKSIRYLLLIEMFNQLRLLKSSSNQSSLEYEFIKKTSNLIGLSDEDITKVKLLVENKYKLISGESNYEDFMQKLLMLNISFIYFGISIFLNKENNKKIDKEIESYKSSIERLLFLFPGMKEEIITLKNNMQYLERMKANNFK